MSKMSIIIILAIVINSIKLMSCDCGIPGVPAFARIVHFNPNMTTYPEGYQVKYDCIDGLNLDGLKERVCKDQNWIPWETPICSESHLLIEY